MATDPNRVRSNAKTSWLKVADIEMTPMEWGRPIRKGDVRAIGANFDPDLLSLPVIWERTNLPVGGGRYCTLDGQHRIRSILDVLQWFDQKIECKVYVDISAQEAARISLGLQERRNFHPYDHYRACLAAGVVGMLEIEKTVTDAGLQVTRSTGSVGEISAIAALTFVRERLGVLGLRRVLAILGRAWGRTPGSFSSKMLKLCAMILAAYPEEVDDDRLGVTLSTRAPNVWLAETMQSKKHLGFIAQDVVMAYNSGLRANRVPEKTPNEYIAASKRNTTVAMVANKGKGSRPKIKAATTVTSDRPTKRRYGGSTPAPKGQQWTTIRTGTTPRPPKGESSGPGK